MSAENADLVVRALAPITRRGFDPDEIDAGEQLLAGFAAQFEPKELRQLAREGGGRDRPGRHPARRASCSRTEGSAGCGPPRTAATPGSSGSPVRPGRNCKPCCTHWRNPESTAPHTEDGKLIEEPDPRCHGQRMHDALADVCERLLRSNNAVPDSGGTPATLIVTIDLEDLLAKTGYTLTSDGTLIKTGTALAAADQADIYWGDQTLHRPDPAPPPHPTHRLTTANHRLATPVIAGAPSPAATSPEWCQAAPHPGLDQGRPDRPEQPHVAVCLPPSQLHAQGLGMPHQ